MNNESKLSCAATLITGAFKTDGRLELLHNIVSFVPFSDHPIYGPYHWPIGDIVSCKTISLNVAGVLPLTNDAIELESNAGLEFQFVVANPNDWVKELG